jgi:23S rRNA (cytosine1962-C5)-methyltransferase
VVQALEGLIAPRGVFERSDADVRHKEGLAPVSGLLAGEAPPAALVFREGACQFLVDVYAGHKTGFYLDQRVNRGVVAERVRALGAPEVLNAFSYTGAFSVAALQAGAAHVTQIDSSTPALAQARRHLGLNGLAESSVADLEGDVFTVLRKLRDSARQFDLIILDPPKFAESQAQVARAARGYKDINLLAFKLLRPGGELVTFSCSGAITPDLFPKIVADAALDAGRSAQILQRLSQSPDHPVALNFPEGEYLKGLVCRDR